MARDKQPFHEVVAAKLIMAPVGITSDLASAKAAEVMTLLDILERSKMPAAAAHRIAADNERLPNLLQEVGQCDLADLATSVFEDLKTRVDEKKESAQPDLAKTEPAEATIS